MKKDQQTKQEGTHAQSTDLSRRLKTGTKRFRWIFFAMCLFGVFILYSAAKTIFLQADYWKVVAQSAVRDSIVEKALRGNIYDCNKRLLVGSVPEYRLCMDFRVRDKDSVACAKAQHFRDSAFVHDLDSIVMGLHLIFPEYKEEYFRKRLTEGFKRKANGWSILPPHLATFIEYQACKKLPLFREKPYKGGFHGDEVMKRKKPYGSLASRTLGALYRDSDRVAKNGIEQAYDSILRGVDGLKHNIKVRNTRVDFIDKSSINGRDLMTTLDVDIQDVAEKALVAQLKSLEAEMGIVIVMEAKTGDVKAMVNMGRDESGHYSEIMNYAISERMEPGSTFKTASLMIALEDGKVDTSTVFDTGSGRYLIHGSWMKDASWSTSGGYGPLSVKRIMEKSSNVGVSRMIIENYEKSPKVYTDALQRIGMGIPLGIPLLGAQDPVMKTPENRSWSRTTLAWMSIGYESLLPPISTCTFYNGIANGGKMMKPRFVKAEMEDGQIVREFPTEVLREKMCSEGTLKKVREVLENVVSAPRGTGRLARCSFGVAGKTGTAQMAGVGGQGYHNGTVRYLVSFCGFFPFDDPQYTCLVCIRKYGLPASGGTHCAPVFAQVAQAVMASGMNHQIPQQARDSNYVAYPTLLKGNAEETRSILNWLRIPNLFAKMEQKNQQKATEPSPLVWATMDSVANGALQFTNHQEVTNRMPDVVGMGARDAVYALQRAGVKAKIKGAGRVVSQSIAPNVVFKRGIAVELTLQ